VLSNVLSQVPIVAALAQLLESLSPCAAQETNKGASPRLGLVGDGKVL
jgi:hypothetical protein